MAKQLCPICSNPSFILKSGIQGYKEDLYFDIYSCAECELQYAIPAKINLDIYNIIYLNIDVIPGYKRYLEYSINVLSSNSPLNYLADAEDVYWVVKECVANVSGNADLKVLEVGCGLGYLTYALNEHGINTLGIDISPVAIENCTTNYGNYYRCVDIFNISDPDFKFDFIIVNEVIEHVDNPTAFIKQLKSFLLPNAKIVLTTPNKSSVSSKFIWDTELPPVHLYWFSEKSIENMAKITGMNVTFTSFERYNRFNTDRTRSANYTPSQKRPHVNKKGEVINGKKLIEVIRILKYLLIFFKIKYIANYFSVTVRNGISKRSNRKIIGAILSVK